MSPEHIQGLAGIDARADVYGFGVLFFEALTGRLPFPGEAGPALLARIVHEPAPRLTSFRAGLPAPIVAIVERALAKDPKDRFPGLEPFIAAVEDHLLPPSPLPRSLSPMAGVPLLSLDEPRAGTGAPAVQVLRRSEPSAPRDPADTREIVPNQADGGAASRRVVQVTDDAARPDAPRPWVRHATGLAVFAGILLFVAWLAFPPMPADPETAPTRVASRPPDGGIP
jgi:serine/threonine-protein kinase